MDHSVEAYDQVWVDVFRYLGMALSIIGVFKTNFVVTTFFNAPNQAYAQTQASYDLTDKLIKSMESIRDGFHSFATSLNLVSTFIPDNTHKLVDYSPQFVFSMFSASVFVQASLLALVLKYLTTAIFLQVNYLDILTSLLNMLVIGMIPDVLITTVPLYLNYRRLYDITYNTV